MNRALTALRRVLEECWRDELLSFDRFKQLTKIRWAVGDGTSRGRAILQSELERLYGVCLADRTPAGARDLAAIALAHAAGLRRDEVVNLDIEDIVDLEAGKLFVRGKGGSHQPANLGDAARYLEAWIAVRGDEPGPVLFHVRANGKIARHRLSPAAVFQILKKRAAEAGVKNCSPHDLRKTFATSLLRAGYDHLMVKRALRHRDVRSVERYDKRTDDEVAAAQRAAIRVPKPGGGA